MEYQLEDVQQVAKTLLTKFPAKKIFLLSGDLGAGKTTLIKSICKEIGVIDEVSSPTFSIVNEYKATQKAPIYHMDLYRLKNENEAIEMGLEEYFDAKTYFFVEWYDIVEHWFAEESIKIHIKNTCPTSRKIIFLP